LPWQRPLRNWKKGPDRSSTNKYLSFGEKIAKVGPVDPEIACLQAIIEEEKEKKKLKHNSLPGKHVSTTTRNA